MNAHRRERSGLHPLRAFVWAVGAGLALYGIGMLTDASVEPLRLTFAVRDDFAGPTRVTTAEPARPVNTTAAAVYFPAQFPAEEARAAIDDPIKSF
jgi:hypothetical protein